MKSFIALFAIIAVVAAQPGLLPLGRATTIAGPSGVITDVEGVAGVAAPLAASWAGPIAAPLSASWAGPIGAPLAAPWAARSILAPTAPWGLGLSAW